MGSNAMISMSAEQTIISAILKLDVKTWTETMLASQGSHAQKTRICATELNLEKVR